MSSDIRAALERLVQALNDYDPKFDAFPEDAMAAARAALAEPVGEGPSAADLLPVEPPNIQTTMAMQYRSAWREGVEDGWNEARAILARWPHPATPPAPEPGEVGEFIAQLKSYAEYGTPIRLIPFVVARAAALLEQLSTAHTERLHRCPTHGQQPANAWGCPECVRELRQQLSAAAPAVVPVAVTERLPGQGDCDAEGRCWIFMLDIGTAPSWRLADPRDIGPYHTHWLPAHALPLPVAPGRGGRGMSWQPIETAPRDGTDVLVLLDSAGVPVVHIAWWRSREEWERSGQYSGGWSSLEEWEGWWSYTRNSISQEKLYGYATPTHWQPLPAPPAPQGGEGEG